MSEKPRYLHDIPLEEALHRFDQALSLAGLSGPLGSESIPLDQAVGRVTAEPVWAATSSPHYHSAAMDGYALRSEATEGASDRTPVDLKIGEGAVYVDTGDPMPDWADAVVPIERIEPLQPGTQEDTEAIRIRASVAPWTHVRPMGEDMVATELVLPSGHTIRPVDLGAIGASGSTTVRVYRKPQIAIIPTGTELVPPGKALAPGDIPETNSLVLAAQVEEWGGQATRMPIVPDNLSLIKEAVEGAARGHDLILVNAGSSAGSEDFTAQAVQSMGELLVHGVAVRPGHPVILGILEAAGQGDRGTPIIGVPGYPVSAALTGEIFVEPLLQRWLGRSPNIRPTVEAVLTRKVRSSLGDDEYLRVTVGEVGDRMVAAPLSRGAGVISSLVRADGLVIIPAGIQGHQAGDRVTVHLYRDPRLLQSTLMVLGSHDLTIDLLAQHMAQHARRVVSANLGSLGGLIALRKEEAHLAGCHLLDPETGEYNTPYIQRYAPGKDLILLGLVYRDQGLIVPQGNPKGITDLEDLEREEVTFINRQRGAGTRILLDYQLEEMGIPAERISGYTREEYSHLNVAASVKSGSADCGLGIHAAAAALGLDFIPLYKERYDLVIPKEYFETPLLDPLTKVLRSDSFRQEVASLPGYDVGPMGEIIEEITGSL